MSPPTAAAMLVCAACFLSACAEDERFPALKPPVNLDAPDLAVNCAPGRGLTGTRAIRMAVDDTHVYWSAPTLHRAIKEGGAAEAISLAPGTSRPDGIALDATHVFIGSHDDALESAPKGGDGAAVLFTDPAGAGVFSVAVDDEHVYWTTHAGSLVRRMPKAGGEVEILSDDGKYATSIAVDESHVYWAVSANEHDPAGASIARAPKDGGATETLASGLDACPSLAVDGAWVYWVTRNDCLVQRAPKEGGPTVTLAEGPEGGHCASIGVDDQHVYWPSAFETLKAPAAVWRVPKDGGAKALMAWQKDAFALALDDTQVYFSSGQSFRRVPK